MNQKRDLNIDFASNANNYRRLHGGGKGQPIARAIGLKTYGLPLSVLDCTAGLGQDAFVLACLGCEVTLLERVPLIAGELRDALQRAAIVTDLQDIIARMHFIETDAIQYLQRSLNNKAEINAPDVIYLDPMFPERAKSALVKKEMRLLKDIVGSDADAAELLQIGMRIAKRRIVVKRPKNAAYLGDIEPHASQIGKANRFDIYMPTIAETFLIKP
jgi:16S rRNA (guanine1516-N2)-methyltransferase